MGFKWVHNVQTGETEQVALTADELAAQALQQQQAAAEQMIIDALNAVRDSGKTDIQSIPDWATWTKEQWKTWYNTNISATQIDAEANLDDAKVIQKKQSAILLNMGKALIALRNREFPDLQS